MINQKVILIINEIVQYVILMDVRIHLRKARELAHDTFGQAQMLH